MASRKKLKKAVKTTVGEIFADCVALTMCEGNNNDELYKLMEETVGLYVDYTSRISHPEPGVKVKDYYGKLRTSFVDAINAVSDKIVKL